MKILKLGLCLIACTLASGQETPASTEKAPAAVDEALRARVKQFYQAYISGRFRDAYLLVAEDAQDAYLEASKIQYKTCDTIRIDYSDDSTKAKVLESCLGVYRWRNANIPTQVPLSTNWKLVDGQWFWYFVRPKEVNTPWGLLKMPPESSKETGTRPLVMPDPQFMAAQILKKVRVDKNNIDLLGYESSHDELRIHNDMPGMISFYFDPIPLPGLRITPLKGDVAANQDVTVVFEYKLDDASVLCGECAKKTKPMLTAQLHIQPTLQVVPVTITFAIPPELEKQIPKELRKPKAK